MHTLWLVLLFAAPPAPLLKAPPAAHAAQAAQANRPVVDYLDLQLRYAQGHLTVGTTARGRFPHPTLLPRYRGRFAARVLGKSKLIDELHFDFPLLADAESNDATEDAKQLGTRIRAGVSSSTMVRVPAPEGADAVEIVDGQTGRRVTVPVPSLRATPPAPDASADSPRAR